jgi:hypothetical protein
MLPVSLLRQALVHCGSGVPLVSVVESPPYEVDLTVAVVVEAVLALRVLAGGAEVAAARVGRVVGQAVAVVVCAVVAAAVGRSSPSAKAENAGPSGAISTEIWFAAPSCATLTSSIQPRSTWLTQGATGGGAT